MKVPENKILLGDVLDVMAKIPADSIDMVFVDPPFNLNKKYSNAKDNLAVTEYLEWCYSWLNECIRVLKPTGTLFAINIPKWLIYFANHLNEQGMKFRHWISWDAMGAPMGKTLLPSHYGILYYTKTDNFKFFDTRSPHKRCRACDEPNKDYGGKKTIMHPYGSLLSDVWTDIHRIRHNKRRDLHPCQMPEQLLERLIILSTDKGDVILDPFVGAGTSCLATKRLDRKYIGIDNSKMYVDITRQKLKEIKRNKTNEYTYRYNKMGQSKTFTKNKFGDIPHTLRDEDLVITKKKLKNEKGGMYVNYDIQAVPKGKKA